MERAPVHAPLIKNLELKVGLLLVGTVLAVLAFVLYALHARGAFEASREVSLIAESAEGASIGTQVSYSGFPVGRIKRMTLTDDGQVRIDLAIPERHARWLREGSIFTMEKPLVGAARIRLYTADLSAPALAEGVTLPLYTGDVTAEIPEILVRVRGLLDHVKAMTAPGASLNQTLAHVSTLTGRMTGEYGVLEGVLGGPDKAAKVVASIDNANQLLRRLDGVSLKVDGMLARTDRQVFAEGGLLPEVRARVAQVQPMLAELRGALARVDAILKESQGTATNVHAISAELRTASEDLAGLRAEVDASLRKVNHLVDEINRKWPFARDVEIKLP